MKSGKLVGFCPDCNLSVASYDVKKDVYTCGGCGSKKKVAKLLKERMIVLKPEIDITGIEDGIEDDIVLEVLEVSEDVPEEDHSLNDME